VTGDARSSPYAAAGGSGGCRLKGQAAGLAVHPHAWALAYSPLVALSRSAGRCLGRATLFEIHRAQQCKRFCHVSRRLQRIARPGLLIILFA
jgi:hypothetical protein